MCYSFLSKTYVACFSALDQQTLLRSSSVLPPATTGAPATGHTGQGQVQQPCCSSETDSHNSWSHTRPTPATTLGLTLGPHQPQHLVSHSAHTSHNTWSHTRPTPATTLSLTLGPHQPQHLVSHSAHTSHNT